MIPQSFLIAGFSFSTFGIFIVLALLLGAYVIWSRGVGDGFDSNTIIDSILISSVLALFFGRLIYASYSFTKFKEVLFHIFNFSNPGIDLVSAFFVFIFTILTITKIKKYSLYRMLDNFVLGGLISISIYFFSLALLYSNTKTIFYSSVLFFVFIFLYAFKKSNYVSGIISSVALIFLGSLIFVSRGDFFALIFSLFLITLGIAILFKRLRYKSMKFDVYLNKDFLTKIRNKLAKKEKELEKDEVLLTKEEGGFGKVEASAEVEDSAYEGARRVDDDILKKSIREMRHQIKRALARIHFGNYGVCEVCHKPIDRARLLAMPQATMCVDCAEKKQ